MITVEATDADDPTYGNSAKLVYSILQGQPYFSVDPGSGETRLSSGYRHSKLDPPDLSWFLLDQLQGAGFTAKPKGESVPQRSAMFWF